MLVMTLVFTHSVFSKVLKPDRTISITSLEHSEELLQGKANLLQLRQEIPLNDSEVAAVDDGVAAMEKLLEQLADVPTPAGPTPRELGNRVCDSKD